MFLISGTTLPPPERLEWETRLKLSIHTKKLSEATIAYLPIDGLQAQCGVYLVSILEKQERCDIKLRAGHLVDILPHP